MYSNLANPPLPIYNDAPSRRNSIMVRIRNINIPTDRPVIITGDFNLHHPLWSPAESTTDPLAQPIVDWLLDQGFSLMNEKGAITHPARHSNERPSVIDLSFVNGPATMADTFQDWAINTNIAGCSDHYGIHFTIDQGRKEINNAFGIKYSLKNIKPEDWTSAFNKATSECPDLMTLAQIENPTHADLDKYTELLTDSLQAATASSVQERKAFPQTKPWWDEDLSNLTKFIAENRMLQKELGTYDPTIQSSIKRSRNFFKKLCQYKKRDWANSKLQNATTDEIWKFPNWSKGI